MTAQPIAQSGPSLSSSPHRSSRGGLPVLIVGEMLTRALSFLAFAHLARALGAESLGKLEVVLAGMIFGQVLVELGFATIGARDIAIDHDATVPLVSRILPIQFLLVGLSWVIWFVVMQIGLLDDITAHLLFAYGFSLLGVPLFFAWVFQGQQRMIFVALPQVLRQLCFAIVCWLFVREPSDLKLLPFAEYIGVGVAAVCGLIAYLGLGYPLRMSSPFSAASRKLTKDSATIGFSQMIWVVRMYFPILLLKFVAGDADVAHFGTANRIVNVYQVSVMVYRIYFLPKLSQHTGRPTFRMTLVVSSLLTTAVMVCGAIGISLLSQPLMQIAYGSEFSTAVSTMVLVVLVWRVPLVMFRSHAGQALVVCHRQRDELLTEILTLIVLVLSGMLAAKWYGIVGLAIAVTATELASALATWAVLLIRTNMLRQSGPGR